MGRPPHHDGASQGVVVRAWRIPEREKRILSASLQTILQEEVNEISKSAVFTEEINKCVSYGYKVFLKGKPPECINRAKSSIDSNFDQPMPMFMHMLYPVMSKVMSECFPGEP